MSPGERTCVLSLAARVRGQTCSIERRCAKSRSISISLRCFHDSLFVLFDVWEVDQFPNSIIGGVVLSPSQPNRSGADVWGAVWGNSCESSWLDSMLYKRSYNFLSGESWNLKIWTFSKVIFDAYYLEVRDIRWLGLVVSFCPREGMLIIYCVHSKTDNQKRDVVFSWVIEKK